MRRNLLQATAALGLALALVMGAAAPARAASVDLGGYTITISRQIQTAGNPVGGGTVTTDVSGLGVSPAALTLIAIAAKGFAFSRWSASGSLAGYNGQQSASLTVPVSGDGAIVAVFVPDAAHTPPPTAEHFSVDGGTWDVYRGPVVTSFMALAANCYVFDHWVFAAEPVYVHGADQRSLTANVATPTSGLAEATPVFTALTSGVCAAPGGGGYPESQSPDVQLPDVQLPDVYLPETSASGNLSSGNLSGGVSGGVSGGDPGVGSSGGTTGSANGLPLLTAGGGMMTGGMASGGGFDSPTGATGQGIPGQSATSPGTNSQGANSQGANSQSDNQGVNSQGIAGQGSVSQGTTGTAGATAPGSANSGTNAPETAGPGGVPGPGAGELPLLTTGDDDAPLAITGHNPGMAGSATARLTPWWYLATSALLGVIGFEAYHLRKRYAR